MDFARQVHSYVTENVKIADGKAGFIAAVAELEIADRLAAGPRTVADLARDCHVLERPLYRALRALAGEGIFGETSEGMFRLTSMAELLRLDHPKSLRDWALYLADIPYRTSSDLLYSLRTGEQTVRKTFGVPLFEYLSVHPEQATRLFRAMSSISASRTAGLLEAYDFSEAQHVLDVGGAHGAMSAAIARRYSSLHCTCFDLPTAQQGAIATFVQQNVSDRCDFVAGDFFVDVPCGADIHLLSAVLHDWDNERCLRILRHCRNRLADNGRVLIVDLVLSDAINVRDTYRNCLDLATLTQTEGMERTESEFRTLLASAGFRLERVIPMNAPQVIIEAVPLT